VNLSGEGVMLYLNSNPLIQVSGVSLLGSLRIFFSQDHFIQSDSILFNYFAPLRHTILSQLPVAYDRETGDIYHYTDFARRVLIESNCGSPTVIAPTSGSMDGGIPPPLTQLARGLDGGNYIDLPHDVVDELRFAPNLGTGYADAGCGLYESLPQRFPYLFELAHALAMGRSEGWHLDLLRLSQDLRTLSELQSRSSNPSAPPSNPFASIDQARVEWHLSPERLALENFLLEFAESTRDHPLSLTLVAGNRGLRTLEIDDPISLSQVYLPGVIHLGNTRFHLRGSGPHLNVSLQEIDSEILPFDLGQSNPSERGFLHIAGGRLRDGEVFTENGLTIPPGVTVSGDLDQALEASLNLRMDLTFQIPGGGSWALSGQLLAQGRLVRSEQGFEPEVGSTWIRLGNLSIHPYRQGVDPSTLPALIENAFLTLTDRSDPDESRTGFRVSYHFSGGGLPFYGGGSGGVFIPVRALDPSTQTYHSERPQDSSASSWVYRPDLVVSDFSTDFQFAFSGQRGTPDLEGGFTFHTSLDANHRIYDALLNLGPVGIPLGGQLLSLNPLQAHFQALQEQSEEGVCHFEVPIFEILANSGNRSGRGILRGGVRIFQTPHAHRPLTAAYDPAAHRVEVQNLDLRFLFHRIVIPALVRASREEPSARPQITGLDLDGRFRGHWSMDTVNGHGHGNLCLVGDSADVSLRGADGRILPDPLVSDTRWCASSIQRADTNHQILWGNFFLDTTFDWGLLRYLGIHLNMRERSRMAHDNLPYSRRGYNGVERLFFQRLQREGREPSREGREAP
jgi:hypothetical protein